MRRLNIPLIGCRAHESISRYIL